VRERRRISEGDTYQGLSSAPGEDGIVVEGAGVLAEAEGAPPQVDGGAPHIAAGMCAELVVV
jgi:hypothetical protein